MIASPVMDVFFHMHTRTVVRYGSTRENRIGSSKSYRTRQTKTRKPGHGQTFSNQKPMSKEKSASGSSKRRANGTGTLATTDLAHTLH